MKNQKEYDCGPVAIINAVYVVSRRLLSYDAVCETLKTDKDGTDDQAMQDALELFAEPSGYELYKIGNPGRNLRRIKKILTSKGTKSAIVLGHLDHYEDWHYSVWDVLGGKELRAHNLIYDADQSTLKFGNFSLFDHLCQKSDSLGDPIAWIVVKGDQDVG